MVLPVQAKASIPVPEKSNAPALEANELILMVTISMNPWAGDHWICCPSATYKKSSEAHATLLSFGKRHRLIFHRRLDPIVVRAILNFAEFNSRWNTITDITECK